MTSRVVIDPMVFSDDYYNTLNKETSVRNCAVDYVKINNLYGSMDPRTYDSPRAQRLYLDSTPRVSQNTQPQGNIYDMETNHVGYYKDYQSIRGGDITYYVDNIADPYSNPTYVIPSYTTPTILVDPMGSIKPYYKRIPIFQSDRNCFEYSFDRDQCGFREDIMSKQSELINRSAFDTYQLFNDPSSYFPGL
jgi:hypothetical protein